MLIVILKFLHISVAIFLILVVLLQTGKGAEMGAAFGGSSQTLFGGSGPASFMAKMTTTAAVLFMLTSLSLAYFSSTGRGVGTSVPITPVSQEPAQVQPDQLPPGEIPTDTSETGDATGDTMETKEIPPAGTGGNEETTAGQK